MKPVIDHIQITVKDMRVALPFYDKLMPLLGFDLEKRTNAVVQPHELHVVEYIHPQLPLASIRHANLSRRRRSIAASRVLCIIWPSKWNPRPRSIDSRRSSPRSARTSSMGRACFRNMVRTTTRFSSRIRTGSSTRSSAAVPDRATLLFHVLDQSNAEMVTARTNLAFTTRTDDISTAILIRAKKRSTAVDALFLAGFGRIE
jgi:hypothetical protein